MIVEIRDIPGFEGLYTVTDDGSIYSIRHNCSLKPKVDRYGYKCVVLCKNGKRHYYTVHRLVAIAFIANKDGLKQINHLNEDKSDNRVSNLEWCTSAHNTNYGTRNIRVSQSKCKRPVIHTLEDGTEVQYAGVKDASRKTGIAHSQITRYCGNHGNSKFNKEWRYLNESY